MRLKQIKLKNFRGYCEEQALDVEDTITAIVGKNDSGKSSILEALEIYFDNGIPDIDDLNVDCGKDREIIITCVFDDLPDSITVDSTADTTLQQEYMVNGDGDLEISKTYRCNNKTVDKEPLIYIRALHPTLENYDDLLTLKIDDLKKRAKDIGVKSSDDRVSNEIRKAIWQKADNLSQQEVNLSYTDLSEKFQSVYKNLEKQFPLFFIFKVDRQTTDADSEAKDPIQVAVKEAKKQFDNQIQALEQEIVTVVKEVTERALKKLHEMDPSLAEKLTPEFKKRPSWLFDFKIHDQRGVPLNKRGSGTRRLVLLNFFRAEAERQSASGEANIIYAMEEPETSQHPNNQNIIIKSLLELADDTKRQVLISTHSSELIEQLPRGSVRFITIQDEIPTVFNGEQGLILAADSLGRISAQKFGSAKKIVLVEGIQDCIFLEHAAATFKQDGKMSKDFKEENIIALPLGGSPGIKKWIENNKAEDLGLKYYILLDSDRTSAGQAKTVNEAYCEQLVNGGHKAHVTRKREIENYIEPSVVNVSFSDFDDAKNIISQASSTAEGKVIETYWTTMTAAQIISNSEYQNSSSDNVSEVLEILKEIVNL
jgi:predicted ATP-dependent endonuclease of OLD family